MSIFDTLNNQAAQPDMRQELSRIQQNPVSYLKSKGFNIPQSMNDPKQITQYLLQSGQVGGPRLRQVMQMLGQR